MAEFLRLFCDQQRIADAQPGSPIRFVLATEGIKRDGLDLVVSGGNFDNYRKNPIVTWAHDFMGQNLPIGRGDLLITPTQLEVDVTFDQEDEFARKIESKYRRGFLNAVSISWNAMTIDGRRVTEWEMLEMAAVPVPGDPSALIKRQFEALKEIVENGASGTSDEGERGKVAAAMAAVFTLAPDDSDAERERRYKALLPKYRRLGMTAPEFLAGEALAALGADEVRGLFFEGEEEFLTPPQPSPNLSQRERNSRAGAVLNTRNRGDLEQAMTLISGVLERATKEEEEDGRSNLTNEPSPDLSQGERNEGTPLQEDTPPPAPLHFDDEMERGVALARMVQIQTQLSQLGH